MIIKIIELLFCLIVVWIGGFILHELFHKYECKRQGGKATIQLWFHKGIPSMLCQCNNATNYDLVALVGGLYSGIFLIGLSYNLFNFHIPLAVSLFMVGLVNLGYSFYEWKMLYKLSRENYMFWHYILYVILLLFGLIIMRNEIWNWMT